MANDTWKPGRKDYLEALQDQNPWQRTGKVPETLAKPVRRLLAEHLWRTLVKVPFRYQVVLGPRRVGKTVCMYQTIQELLKKGVAATQLWFLRLDHPLLMHYELGAWARSLINNYPATVERPLYLFLDEVNYSPRWDKWLKTFYDEQWPVRVIATSSSTAALRGRTVESGIGRWSEQFLTPYTFIEFLLLRKTPLGSFVAAPTLYDTLMNEIRSRIDHTHINHLLQLYLLVGGFPELLDALAEDDVEGELFRSQQILRTEAVQRVAGMDIPQAFDIKNPLMLERLLYILAGQMCGLMNISHLAQDLELSRATTHQYINYLEQAYLIFTLPAYSASEESIQRKGKRVYFVDGAVRNAALQRGTRPMIDPAEWGHLIENAAAAHLYALSLQSGIRLFHWRDREMEVDLIYDQPDHPVAFEIATRPDHSKKGLLELQRRYPIFCNRCFMISASSDVFRSPIDTDDGIGHLPLCNFLLVIGNLTREALYKRLEGS